MIFVFSNQNLTRQGQAMKVITPRGKFESLHKNYLSNLVQLKRKILANLLS